MQSLAWGNVIWLIVKSILAFRTHQWHNFNRSAKFSLIKHENKHADASEKIINVSWKKTFTNNLEKDRTF